MIGNLTRLARIGEGDTTVQDDSDVRSGSGERVLVVDDQPPIRKILASYLRDLDYEVIEADGVTSAVAMIETQKFDLVITDVRLNDGNGIEMISRFDPLPQTLFISGCLPQHSPTQPALEEGRNFIQKPFRLNQIAVAVARLIGS